MKVRTCERRLTNAGRKVSKCGKPATHRVEFDCRDFCKTCALVIQKIRKQKGMRYVIVEIPAERAA